MNGTRMAVSRHPHHIGRKDGEPFAMAGIVGCLEGPEGEVLSCTIIVTDANPFMKKLHDRMPVILEPKNYEQWLDPDNKDTAKLKQFLVPEPGDGLTKWPVSRALNNPRNEGPECASRERKTNPP